MENEVPPYVAKSGKHPFLLDTAQVWKLGVLMHPNTKYFVEPMPMEVY
jgi:hypothetical protein